MKKALFLSTLLFSGALALDSPTSAHGGTYRGPGDTVPPGGGNGGPGNGPAPGSGGPSGPSAPSGPSGPQTGGGNTGSGGGGSTGGGSRGPTTPGGEFGGPDLTDWQFWWGFNKDPYLNLKAHLNRSGPLTGDTLPFLGHGQESEVRDFFAPSDASIRSKIVPALLDALANEKNNDILTGALIALAKIGDAKDLEGHSEFEQVIVQFLSDPVQEVRETAAVALGILGNPKSIRTLEHLALDDARGRELVGRKAEVHFRTRAFATYGLGLVGYRASSEERQEIVRTLQRILEEPRQSTRDVKVAALLAMGLVPVADSVHLMARTGRNEEIDPTLSRSHQVRYLLDYLQDEGHPWLVRAHAPRSIARLVDGVSESLREDAATALLEYVGKSASGERRELRQSATLALGQIGNCDGDGIDAEIHEQLLDAASDTDRQTRFFSLISLAQVSGRAGSELAPYGPHDSLVLKKTRKHLTQRMARGRMQPWAALALGVLGNALNESNPDLFSSDISHNIRSQMSEERDPQDVGAYALALGLRRDPESIQLLTERLERFSDDAARGQIAIGLGLVDAREAIAPIHRIVVNSKYRPDLLKQAAIALGLLGDSKTVPQLLAMLKDARSLASQASIAQALGFIGDSRSIDPLVEMLEDDQLTARARGFAAVALGIIADKEPLPWSSKVSVNINYRANTSSLTGFGGTGLLDIL